MDDTIDKIALCEDISEPNCSDSDQPHSDDKITTKQDLISVKVKSTFCLMCWFYDQGTGIDILKFLF